MALNVCEQAVKRAKPRLLKSSRRYILQHMSKLLDKVASQSVRIARSLRQGLTWLWTSTERVALWEMPVYRRWVLYTQATLIVLSVFLCVWWPLVPGIAIGLVGVVGIIMAAFADWKSYEKAAWIAFAAVLFIVEFQTVERDRHTNETEQTIMRDREQEAIRKEEEAIEKQQQGFTEVVKQGQSLFANEKRLSQEDRDQMTGGDSYVIVVPNVGVPLDGGNTFALTAAIGKNGPRIALQNVRILVRKLPIENEFTMDQIKALLAGSDVRDTPTLIGIITPDDSLILPMKISPPLEGTTEYFVNVDAVNKPTIETFRVRHGDKGWEYSFNVSRVVAPGGPHKKDKLKVLEVTKPEWRTQVVMQPH